MTNRLLATLLIVLAAGYPISAQSETPSATHETAAASTKIEGAGSTTINPVFQAWIEEYTRLHPGFQMSYTSSGSRGGFRVFASGQAFFGVTEAPISDDQLQQAKGRILQFPIVVNSVVPVYNLPGVPQLRFSGSTLAEIFLGKITKWNDPAIAKENPEVDLPGVDIKVHHDFPSAGRSGTPDTFVMVDYLSKVSPAFKAAIANSSANWPLASSRYNGATGTLGFVTKTPGSFGYLPLVSRAFSREDSLTYADVKNSDGEFVTASPDSVTAASVSAMLSIGTETPDFRISITNAPGKASYPIASFIWLLIYENPKDNKQNEVMTDFLKWVLTDGQKTALKLWYGALPSDLVQVELQQLRSSAR